MLSLKKEFGGCVRADPVGCASVARRIAALDCWNGWREPPLGAALGIFALPNRDV